MNYLYQVTCVFQHVLHFNILKVTPLTVSIPCERNLRRDLEKEVKLFQVLQESQKWKEKKQLKPAVEGRYVRTSVSSADTSKDTVSECYRADFLMMQEYRKNLFWKFDVFFSIWGTSVRRPWHFYSNIFKQILFILNIVFTNLYNNLALF